MKRIAITGWPKTGKTTLANRLGKARSTDETIPLGWSEGSQEVARWFDQAGPLLIEGVAVPRALRKWREQHPGARPPIDKLIVMETPREILSPGQAAMGKGLDTVLNEILPWLSGEVEIEYIG